MKAYERFINYAKLHTTSSEETNTHPSSEGQWDLAKLLEKELKSLGLVDVLVDEHCYVYGFLPAKEGYEKAPALGFVAHMDTSPDAPGENVNPILRKEYDGGDIHFPKSLTGAEVVLSPKDYPFLASFKGETLISSDGSTLIGSDDKAGIAEIITALERLVNENLPHGDIYVAFTPDEEIGEGTDYFNLEHFPAKFAYTLDGGDIDEIECENFNAAEAKITINGFSVHPGSAKDKLVNSQALAMEFHSMLPAEETPENTEGREGFYHLHKMSGIVESSTLVYIIRDHDKELFEKRKSFILSLVSKFNSIHGKDTATAKITDTYYNMIEKIKPHYHLVDSAKEAIESLGLSPKIVPIRGGTDGARLSFMGIPTPNLGTGGYNFHSVFEINSIERMDKAVLIILYLIDKYAKKSTF